MSRRKEPKPFKKHIESETYTFAHTEISLKCLKKYTEDM